MKLIAIYGASGFGREVMGMLPKNEEGSEYVFIDDSPPADHVNGHRCLSWDKFLLEPAENRTVSLAIGDGKIREALMRKCETAGVALLAARAESAVVLDNVELGAGSVLCPFSMITSNVKIGHQFHANIYSYVAHDCTIGDYVTFAPGVKCNGNVVVEDHAYIGSGAILRQGRPGDPLVIGKGAIVGMGAVVTKNVLAGATVVGNPARPLEHS